MLPLYNEKKARQSELLQILILDALYAQTGSQHFIFQGGTALRWVYGGHRFSEDLDFVSDAEVDQIRKVVEKSHPKFEMACLAQFGPGALDRQVKRSRETACRFLFIYRPERQRERIAVKVEFEQLAGGRRPETDRAVLADLPAIAALSATGQLMLPYTSSIILVETPQEILADKIRALYERPYIKGRDIFDLWWLVNQLKLQPDWPMIRAAFERYREKFKSARESVYFQSRQSRTEILKALESDLVRFLPPETYLIYHERKFVEFLQTTERVTAGMLEQGMKDFIDGGHRR